MSNQIKLPISMILLLDEMVNTLITKTYKKADGTTVSEERDLPFKLKFSLVRNKAILDRFVEQANTKKTVLLAEFGDTRTEDVISITKEENLEKFKAEFIKFLDTEVTISVSKLDVEELKSITDTINFSENAIKVLLAYLVEDNDYFNDFKTAVNLDVFTAAPKEEPKVEEPKVEEVKAEKPKKTTVKKTTTTKKTTTKKTTKK